MDSGTIQILFQKSPLGIWERLIKFWTRGPYFHSAILLPGNDLYESIDTIGVHHVPNFTPPAGWDIVELHPGAEAVEKMREFLKGELGCPYDWSGLFWSQILFIPRSHANAWICSELVAAALGLYYKMAKACKYSPNGLNRQVKKPSEMIPK
jgi:hypothetical protein